MMVHLLCNNLSVKQATQKLGEAATKSIVAEMVQHHTRPTWHPVSPQDLSAGERRRIIKSHMFLKEKHDPEGNFEKLKARLVARGDMEDRSMYDDVSSPTISLQASLTIAALAAREKRKVAVVDITSAYLNAKMEETVVHMSIEPALASILVAMDPDTYEQHIQPNGTLVVRLDRALYGCLDSARLWYRCLSEALSTIGFVPNKSDPCVMNRSSDSGVQCTIGFHVDDLKITCVDENTIDEVIAFLQDRFGAITSKKGLKHSYLGMTFDYHLEKKSRSHNTGW
jgi:hypothetical protein